MSDAEDFKVVVQDRWFYSTHGERHAYGIDVSAARVMVSSFLTPDERLYAAMRAGLELGRREERPDAIPAFQIPDHHPRRTHRTEPPSPEGL